MNCRDVQAQLSAYLDGKAMQPASKHLKQHLANCVRCGDALQKEIEMRVLLRELKDVPVPNPPADFADRAFAAAFTQQRVGAVKQEDEAVFAVANALAAVDASSERAYELTSVVNFDRSRVVNSVLNSPQAVTDHHQVRRQGFFWGFSSAAAVALMMWGVSAMIMTSPQTNHPSAQVASDDTASNVRTSVAPGNQSEAPVLRVALHETKQVKLAFKAQRAVEKAHISISLPENVILEGFPGKRTIEWETQLAAGDNVLSLPILADQPITAGESDFLVAKVSHQGGENTLSVRLQVVKPGLSHVESDTRNSA